MIRAAWVTHVGAIVLALTGVGCCKKSPDPAQPAPPTTTTLEPPAQPPSAEQVSDMLTQLPRCDVFHRGVFLDLGSAFEQGRSSYSLTTTGSDATAVERGGASWAQVWSRTFSQTFHTDHPSPVFVAGRMLGLAARRATVRIDGRVYGTLSLNRTTAEVSSTKASAEPLEPGAHTLTIQFHGSAHGRQAFAEIDWLRVGEPDEDPTTFAPPSERDIVVDSVVAGRPRRSVALRAPGMVRCAVAAREGMTFQSDIGYLGPGSGKAEVRVTEPGQSPVVVHAAEIGGEKDLSSHASVSLDSYAGKLVLLELVATRSSSGARVLFGEPTLAMRPALPPPRTPAKAAILVVMSKADKAHLPPYAEVPALAALTSLAQSSVVFRQHRAVTTVSSAAMASSLSGLPPENHGLIDPASRLPAAITTVAGLASEGRVSSAMFTANPMSFEAFGFGRGWDRFEVFSPVSGHEGRGPMTDGTRWLEARLQESGQQHMLAVLHTRGGHPPWTTSADEARDLPPADYSGPVEARRAGQVLARARGKRPKWRMTPADRERLEALFALALVSEDQALGALVSSLRKAGVWDSTLLIVTSDLALGGPARVPFADAERLDEDLLDLPLIVHFPGGRYGGKAVQSPTSALDLVPTLLGALGLQTPPRLAGTDLYDIAAHPERHVLRPQYATIGREYAVRFGNVVLRGESPKPPVLCDLALGANCPGTTPPSLAVLAHALWRQTFAWYRATDIDKIGSLREPATLDPDTVSALTVWGNQENH